jgi:glycosyltransferase involved in cell wall biosynthesis
VEIIRHWRPPDGRLRRRRFEDHLTHVPLSYLSLVTGDDHIVQALHVTDGLAAARWSARTGRPSVLTHLGLADRHWLRDARRRVEITNAAASGCTVVTAVSRHAAATFMRWLGIEARAIYPAVDLDRFRPCAERAEAPTIFCAAPADQRHKRVGLLVDAFRHVRRDRPQARLVLLRPADPRLAQALESNTDGVDLIDNEAALLPQAYSRAWITTLTSIGEAFGLVLAESLACGTPIVGSRHGGIPEIVDSPAVGRIFTDDDPAAIARTLVEALELCSDDGTTEACRRRAEAFSTARCVEAHERLYAELLTDDRIGSAR